MIVKSYLKITFSKLNGMTDNKRLMYGNEAVARGAYEAGVSFVAGYPGTPSTEIVESATQYPDIEVRWSINEKVAVETAVGVSKGGGRAMAVMKHVGLNVAADAFMNVSYTGVNGGLVIVSADDPGLFSSQNEQDNRWYALMAKITMLEPADSQEAKDFTQLAFEISEEYDVPVLLRLTTRVCHSKGSVICKPRNNQQPRKEYEININKYVNIPGNARKNRIKMVERQQKLKELSNTIEINTLIPGHGKRGVITSGIAYQYVQELSEEIPILKLGMTYPIPDELIKKFCEKFERVTVVEELDNFLETQILALGCNNIETKSESFTLGELNPSRVENLLKSQIPEIADYYPKSGKPPAMCPGCSYLGVFSVLKKMNLLVEGDIGCYTLGALPPMNALHSFLCMGASMGMANGLATQLPSPKQDKLVAVIGDSTFFHSGLPELVDMVYHGWNGLVIILDNRTTAMTGMQEHPGTGKNRKGEPLGIQLDLVKVAKALGATYVKKVLSSHLGVLERAFEKGLAHDGVAVVIAEEPCRHLEKGFDTKVSVDQKTCTLCHGCLNIGCSAISKKDNAIKIANHLCIGCQICSAICPTGALKLPMIIEENNSQ
jgi:indolepyruvate ferredoxin oxidoreductase alpha subunit